MKKANCIFRKNTQKKTYIFQHAKNISRINGLFAFNFFKLPCIQNCNASFESFQ